MDSSDKRVLVTGVPGRVGGGRCHGSRVVDAVAGIKFSRERTSKWP
jgi:hypothetical protein